MSIPKSILILCVTLVSFLARGSDGLRPFSVKTQKELPQAIDDSETWGETLSWTPRATLWHKLLNASECDHLIKLAEAHLQKSSVVDSITGASKLDEVRTSSGMFLIRGQDDIVRSIEEKIAMRTMIPVNNGEGLQILRYNDGEKYSSHFDYFQDQMNQMNGGQRVATMLMYLSDVVEGGETVFPDSLEKPTTGNARFSDCAQAGVAVKPKKGDALFFYGLHPDADEDPSSLHGGCPVIKGTKWSATKWMRVKEFGS